MRSSPSSRSSSALLLVALLASACGGGTAAPNPPPPPPPPTPVATVTVDPVSATVGPTQTVQLSASTKDAVGNTLSGRSVAWSSSSTAAATVDGNGLVTAVAPGAATVTATSEGRSGTAQITVQAPVASVTVTPATASIFTGATAPLAASLKDAASNVLTGRPIAWSTGNAAVATVDGSGIVTAVAPGSATITATSEGKTGTAQVTVLAPVATVTVTPPSASLFVGATAALAATLKDGSNNVLTGRPVVWSTSNPATATVDANGIVTAVAPGTATIAAAAEGKSGTAQITVLAPVATVTVTPATSSLVIGRSGGLTVILRDVAGNVLTGRPTAWSTSNPAIATVDGVGVVTAVSAGVATITATSEGRAGAAQVTVLAPVASVVVTGALKAKVGDTYTFTATARLAGGAVVVRPVTWSIVETDKGSMTPDGVLVPFKIGLITLVATIDGVDWVGSTTGYDWTDLSSGGAVRIGLRSDTQITNKFGTAEYPDLIISCTAGGYLFVYVAMSNFVTSSGFVSYNFDNGPIVSRLWSELAPSYNSLWHPGPTNVERRTFAAVMALARRFGFAFTEFNAGAKAMIFRVTGLDAIVAPVINACPSNSLLVAGDDLRRDFLDLQASARLGTPVVSESRARDQAGPRVTAAPALSGLMAAAEDSQMAVRRP